MVEQNKPISITESNIKNMLSQLISKEKEFVASLVKLKNETLKKKNEELITPEEYKLFIKDFDKKMVNTANLLKPKLKTFLQAYKENDEIASELIVDGIPNSITKSVCRDLKLETKGGENTYKITVIKKKENEKKNDQKIEEVEGMGEAEEKDFLCPEPIEEIKLVQIKSNSILVGFLPPENNGCEIISYRVEVRSKNGNEDKIEERLLDPVIPLEIQIPSNAVVDFRITPKNEYGFAYEEDNKWFTVRINEWKRGAVFMAGDCTEIQIPKAALNKSNPKFLEKKERKISAGFVELDLFTGWTQTLKTRLSTLLLLDSGKVVQWGPTLASDDPTINEVHPDDQEKYINTIMSDPFYLIDHQKPSSKIFVTSLACGRDFSLLTTVEGHIYSWGKNYFGQLGLGDNNIRLQPTRIKGTLENEFVVDISSAQLHSLALTKKGKVYTWGFKQALFGDAILDPFGKIVDYINKGTSLKEPREVSEVLGYYKVKKISAGSSHSAAITECGNLFTWGDNDFGQLGVMLEQNAPSCMVPRNVSALKGLVVIDVSCGNLHTLALVQKGIETEVWSWGAGKFNQLGFKDKANRITPKKIESEALSSRRLVSVSAGFGHSLALDEEGRVFGWGRNAYGALGIPNNFMNISEPTMIDPPELKGLHVEEVIALTDLTVFIGKGN